MEKAPRDRDQKMVMAVVRERESARVWAKRKAEKRVGRKSKVKGDSFERYVARRVMPCHSPHKHWRRTKFGEKQRHGDIIPTTVDGEIISLEFYVECRRYARLRRRLIMEWVEEVRSKAGDKFWFLVFKQDQGPIYFTNSTMSLEGLPFFLLAETTEESK